MIGALFVGIPKFVFKRTLCSFFSADVKTGGAETLFPLFFTEIQFIRHKLEFTVKRVVLSIDA